MNSQVVIIYYKVMAVILEGVIVEIVLDMKNFYRRKLKFSKFHGLIKQYMKNLH